MEKARSNEEYLAQRTKWRNFKENEAPFFPYPQNLLMVRLFPADFFWKETEEFLNKSDEEKKDILAGVEWAIQTLPTKMRLAIEYHYRDNLRPKDGAKLLRCENGAKFTSFRKRGEQRIQYIANPLFHTMYQYGLKKAKEEWSARMDDLAPTPIEELGLSDKITAVLRANMFEIVADLELWPCTKSMENLICYHLLPLTKQDVNEIEKALTKFHHQQFVRAHKHTKQAAEIR